MPALLRRLVGSVGVSAILLIPVAARANPLNGQVTAGQATIGTTNAKTVTINQSSPKAIINWQSFNIAPGETTRFIQPGGTSVTLNRVTGNLGPSDINGILSANGSIFVVNPDGILFGPSAQITVGSFLATTHDITDGDFMSGNYNFTIPGNPSASIVNEGTITAASGGFAALVAPGVRNAGIITARLGTVALASGNGFTLDLYGDNLINLEPSDAIASNVIDVATGQTLTSLVQNTGKLKANGGTVSLTAVAAKNVLDSVINSSGVIEANTVGIHKGLVVFGAATAATKPLGAPAQIVKVSGTIRVAGKAKNTVGGTIQITGEDIELADARLDASGQAGGGSVFIGGAGTSGLAATIPTATDVSFDAATMIDASATENGNGGNVVVWSDLDTTFAGTIEATGGATSGNGGSVETSGQTLDIDGASVSTAAPDGQSGQWLLDPDDFTIDAAAASTIEGNLANGNVTISTSASGTGGSGDITVDAPVTWSDGNSLTLSAYQNIAVDADITNSGGAAVNLRADNSGDGAGTVAFNAGAKVSTTGVVSIFYDPSVNPAGSIVNASSYVTPSENFSADVIGGGQLTAYMLVNTVYDLQNMENNLSGTYALGTDIDASATATWNDGAGFVPLGNASTEFDGTFDGQGNTIDGLTINSTGQYSALFGAIGINSVVSNVGLINASVTGTQSDFSGWVGTLAGINNGEITQSYATGSISGAKSYDIGGLVARNYGSIIQSYANVSTNGGVDSAIGGLVGNNFGSITQSYSIGPVNAGSDSDIGGLTGENSGSIIQSYAAGMVSAPSSTTGGLVGYDNGLVGTSYWDTTATGQASGFGENPGYASATGQTTAQLLSGLPTGFDPAVWESISTFNGGYPYLLWQTVVNTTPASPPTPTPTPSSTPTPIPTDIIADTTNPPLGTTPAPAISCKTDPTPNFGLNTTGPAPSTRLAGSGTWQNFSRMIASGALSQKPIAAADLAVAENDVQNDAKKSLPGNSDAMALSRIGSSIIVHNQVSDVTGAKKSPIAVGDDVFSDELVQTGVNSDGKLLFSDDTNLSIGPISTVKLDRFVYSGPADYSTAAINLTKGTFRFITGKSPKTAYQIQTPVATVGVRGTIVDIKIESGRTIVALQEGAAIICPRGKTQCITLTPGQTADVTSRRVVRGKTTWSFASSCTGNGALCEQTTVAAAAATFKEQQAALAADAVHCVQ